MGPSPRETGSADVNLNSPSLMPQTPIESREVPLARRSTAPDTPVRRDELLSTRTQRDAAMQDIGIAVVLAGAGLMTSIAFGLISPDGIFHYDDLTHYLYAKWAWKWPAYLVDSWGRPGFTVLYFLPAGLGWGACRVLSAVLTAVSALLAFFVARRMGLRHAWAVVLLAYTQPLFFQLSQTTLTETALAFYLILAVFLAQRGRWALSAAVLSIGLVTRHEAAVFVPLWAWFAWRGEQTDAAQPGCEKGFSHQRGWEPEPRHSCRDYGPARPEGPGLGMALDGACPSRGLANQGRALLSLWPIVWAPLVVNAACWFARLETPLSHLLEPKPSELYGHGDWLTFFSRTLEAWGPGVTVLAMLGLYGTWRSLRGGALVTSCIVVYFAAQTVVRALGLYDSGGYARFLVPISPLVAVAALAGWHRLWVSDPRRLRLAVVYAAGFMVLLRLAMERQVKLYASQPWEIAAVPHLGEAVAAVRFAAVALAVVAALSCVLSFIGERRASSKSSAIGRAIVPAAIVAMILLADYALCYPLRPPAAARMVDDLRTSLRENGLAGREIISAHVWIDYAAGNELPLPRPSVCRRLQLAPIGAVFVWDGQFAATERGLQLAGIGTSSAFRRIYTAQPIPPRGLPYFIAFEKVGHWDCPAPER
jgi:hypothetical protein